MNNTLPKLEIIFEDNHQLVLNKPAGLLTQPNETEADSLETQAKLWLKQKCNKPGNVFLAAVHRLDKPVSGIVLFAKTSKALERLNEAMRQKKTHKMYLAWVEGDVITDNGTLEHHIIHDDYKATITSPDNPKSKIARLHYKVIERKKDKTLLEIVLETGRYHQIRAQLSAIGHPILGDTKYGSVQPYHQNGIALHHFRLEIPHPITKQIQIFESNPTFKFQVPLEG